jgi:hypothetical protein
MKSKSFSAKIIFLSLGMLLVALFVVLVYRAYVIHKPCSHKIKALDESTKIRLSSAMLNRFQRALQIRTISTRQDNYLESKVEFVEFLRKGFSIF